MKRIVIIGFGSIAKKHIKAIHAIDAVIEIIIVRLQHKDSDLADCQSFVSKVLFNLEEAWNLHPDMVIISNPAPFHVDIAVQCIERNIPVFIEKPLADSNKGVDVLIEKCQEKKSVVMVGYCLHYFKPLMMINEFINQGKLGRVYSVTSSVGQWLPNWRPQSDYRKNVTARRELGGGVILELSHEIDCLRWWLGKATHVNCVSRKISDLEIDVEDTAEITVEFESGAIGHVHLDFIDQAFERSARIVGSKGTIVWEAHEGHRVRFFDAQLKVWEEVIPKNTVDVSSMYENQMKSFFKCVEEKLSPEVGLIEGVETLRIILAAKESSQLGRKVSL